MLYGNSGTGKTHLMVAAIRRLVLERARPIRFVEFVHLLSDMKASFGDRSRGQDLITPLVEVPVLAIDELGKGRGTDWEMSVLDELISKRYNTERTTLFTTNYDPTKTEGQDALVTHVGQRILSRLKEMCRWVEVNGADYREKLSPSIQIRSGNAISTKPAPQASPAERLDRRDGAHGVSNKPLHR
ncbi:ATP-binding protein [Myxococcota bacterium]|nr:ATP-binding protein [Myxococcota bacterium]MBU1898160.1 ATP-binding protein [Myxococcota bacterium]